MNGPFDYIVVGAGSAGCLLANRLSADPRVRVLLLEAGGRGRNPLIRVPMVAGLLYFMPSLNWGYETVPQGGLDGRSLVWPRGRVLGGSSAINGMMYIRGTPADYDQWRQSGLAGWGYEDVLPFFRSFERNVSHADRHFHGHEGELWTERARGENPIYGAWLDSARAAGADLNPDFNGARQEGVGYYDFNIRDGRRVTAATAFLDPIRGRQNLSVITDLQVAKLTFHQRQCTGLLLLDGRELTVKREVILCAGTVNSPQLLELSGIGDGERLQKLGIPVVAHSPEVGRNLQDHLGIYVQHTCTQPVTLYGLMRPDRAIWAGLRDLAAGKGPASSVPLEAGGFLKTRRDLDEPDVHITAVPGLSLATTRLGQMRHGFLTNLYQLRPHSRGTTYIVSPDAGAKPRIDPCYLNDPLDVQCLREGTRLIRSIVGQAPLDPLRGEEIAPGAGVSDDDDDAIDAWVRSSANTIFHPVGTCRMGADERAVVDGALRVRGVESLRVVDASIMPTITSGNTAAPTMMIAEKAASMIRAHDK
ncbi:GMC family oxidoreductase [Novosphingobium sp. Gsoil 351]|uniref:GMC family oxidoreductase n=1 Tax=Novosphingobium sp. Gsoil 351 TaxID=2675225 RepID=UPI0012B4C214|nr:GMC family oxidoreductase N-terminal domain-containing protein [Novosphingobium sp. Gsoil 351]QGN55618.1 choline dehydrogenase [Novosphingobium sp. Gsoil 351]